jgi:hypothetical protein
MFRSWLDHVCGFVRYGQVTCGSAHILSATNRMFIGREKKIFEMKAADKYETHIFCAFCGFRYNYTGVIYMLTS